MGRTIDIAGEKVRVHPNTKWFVYVPSSSIHKKSKKDEYCLTFTNSQLARSVKSSIPRVQLQKRMVNEAITTTETTTPVTPLTHDANDDSLFTTRNSNQYCATKATSNSDNHFCCSCCIQNKNGSILVPTNTTLSVSMHNSGSCMDTITILSPVGSTTTTEMNTKVFTNSSVPLVCSSFLGCEPSLSPPPAAATASVSPSRTGRKKHRLDLLRMKNNSEKIAIRNLLN